MSHYVNSSVENTRGQLIKKNKLENSWKGIVLFQTCFTSVIAIIIDLWPSEFRCLISCLWASSHRLISGGVNKGDYKPYPKDEISRKNQLPLAFFDFCLSHVTNEFPILKTAYHFHVTSASWCLHCCLATLASKIARTILSDNRVIQMHLALNNLKAWRLLEKVGLNVPDKHVSQVLKICDCRIHLL